ncbi:hypothetical protein Tco_0468257 [Tanacetum coccineum]
MMDDPNNTMEEYIRLEEEKARKCRKVFNCETAKYGKIWYDEDIHDLRYVETEFHAIAFNDKVSSEKTLSYEPTVSSLNDEIDFRVSFDDSDDEDYTDPEFSDPYTVLTKHLYGVLTILIPIRYMALPPREQRHPFLRYEELQYTEDDIADFESRLTRIHRREVHRVQVFDFGGLPDMMVEGLSARMLMEHRDAQSVFTSRAWRRLFDIRGPLVHKLVLEFFSTFRFGEAVTDLDTPGALQFQLGGARRRMSWREFILALGLYTAEEMHTFGFGAYWADSARQIPGKGDLRDYWIGISSAGDFLGTAPSYTAIRDPILRLCQRLITCSIAGRSQAPEKVTVIDLFYLRGMDFVARLAEHFGLLTAEILRRLTIIAPELPIIDMAELAPPHPPPPAAARTMPQRMARLEEDVYKIHGELTEQREVIDAMARDFSRFCTWTTTSLARMMDRAGVTYMSYSQTLREYQRRVRCRTDDASTSDIHTKMQNEEKRDDFKCVEAEEKSNLKTSLTLEAKNIDEYWWRIYKSGDLKVLES